MSDLATGDTPPDDPFDLARFVHAQEGQHDRALAEIRRGRKTSHWMWYVFPQLAGLGQSPMSRRYAITGLAEADAYLRHPVLGPRLVACAEAVLGVESLSAHDIFGDPDDRKLHSCATLFAQVATGDVFDRLIERFFEARYDDATMRLLAEARPGP